MTINKKKTIKKLIKIVLIISVIVAVINFVCPAPSEAKVENSFVEACAKIVGDLLDGLMGLLFWPFRLLILLVGKGMEVVLAFFVPGSGKVTIEGILFNKIDVLSINFMDVNGTNYEPAKILRQNVASWYTGVRNLSAAILVIICIYTGIRMALATATDKAKYKEMLINWASSVALLFVLHYVMAGVITVNNLLVQAIGNGITEGTSGSINVLADSFFDKALWGISFAETTAYTVCYLTLTFMTFTFIIMYLKRLITIAFLMIIAPLVTITYSIDKMGDGRAQGLNNWFREFLYNIIIQPFHCIAFAALGGMATTLAASKDAGLAEGVACIIIIGFIIKSEKILKTIFHMQSDSMMDALNSAAIASNISNRAMQFSKQVTGSVKQTIKANRANAEEIRKVKDEIKIAKGKATRAQIADKNEKRKTNQAKRTARREKFEEKHPKISGFSRDLLAFQGDANATLFNGVAAFSMGLAQGDENAAIMSGLRQAEATHKERKQQSQEFKRARLQHKMATAYNNYRDREIKGITEKLKQDPNFLKMKEKDQTELIERTFDRKVQDLLNKGTMTNLNDTTESNLVHAMDELQHELESQGLSGDAAMKQVQAVAGKIGRGEIGEVIEKDITFDLGDREIHIPLGTMADYEFGDRDVGGHKTNKEVIEEQLKSGSRQSTSNSGPRPSASKNTDKPSGPSSSSGEVKRVNSGKQPEPRRPGPGSPGGVKKSREEARRISREMKKSNKKFGNNGSNGTSMNFGNKPKGLNS